MSQPKQQAQQTPPKPLEQSFISPPGIHVPNYSSVVFGGRVLYAFPNGAPGDGRQFHIVEYDQTAGKLVRPREFVDAGLSNDLPSAVESMPHLEFLPDRDGDGYRQLRCEYITPDNGKWRVAQCLLPVFTRG